MQLLTFALLTFAPAVVRAASSGLSTGAMVAIIVESAVIFLLFCFLLHLLRQLQIVRRQLKAARVHDYPEAKRPSAPASRAASLRDHSDSNTFLVHSPQEEQYEESHVALLPPSLRPASRSFSSPASVRSSTLYDFTPRQEDFGFDFKSYRPTTYVQPPVHIAEVTAASLPNPHSEDGHATDDDDDVHSSTHESLEAPLPSPAHHSRGSSDSDGVRTPRARTPVRAPSESSWAEDVVNALDRGPTPISRSTTATTTTSIYTEDSMATPITSGVHDLLIARQRESGSHTPSAEGPQV